MNYRLIYYLSIILTLWACESEFDKYYDVDQGDGETIYNVLKAKEGFDLFTNALSAANYENTLASSGLFTVMAVSDENFSPALDAIGIDSEALKNPSSLSPEQVEDLKLLVGMHILDWSYTVEYLTGAFDKNYAPVDPQYFRRLTRCQPAVIDDEVYDEDGDFNTGNIEAGNITDGAPILVVPQRKLIPFFSDAFLQEKELTSSDLDFFIQNGKTFNAGDVMSNNGAKIIEADISALNGWIQVLDAPLSYQPNHYEILQNKASEYSTILSLFERFTSYDYDEDFTEQYGGETYAFVKDISALNDEYTGTENNHLSTANTQRSVQKSANTLIAPTNASLDAFLQTQYGAYYNAIPDSIPDLQVKIILESLLFQNANYFPSDFANGNAVGKGGVPLPYDMTNDADYKIYASNGPFYGVSTFHTPTEYKSVTREISTNPNYTSFLAVLRKSGMYDILVSDGTTTRFTLVAVPNKVFEDEGILYWEEENKFIGADSSNIPNSQLKEIAENHIFLGEVEFNNDFWKFNTNLRGSVVKEMQNEVQGSGNTASFSITKNKSIENNGYFYETDGFIKGTSDQVVDILASYAPFESFYDSLVSLELITNDRLFVRKTPFTCFILDNAMMAIEAAKFPADREERQNYFKSYFLEDAVYNDDVARGYYATYANDSLYNDIDLNITNTKTEFSITDPGGNTIPIDPTLKDFLREDGVIHKLTSAIELQ